MAGSTFPDQVSPEAEKPTAAPEPPAASKVPAAHESFRRAELQKEIRLLEAEKAEMLTKFSPQHPDVRAVERKLRFRRKQLEDLKP